ncbi:hypothetical protein QAD02_017733 [Eretmocerus hayati]|uniref:Uncharacterized protein n=1 Tax=Eretmocerus hayati TaxID=131215 RepID=A0ACC2PGK3_9HYME|nr:hypothetical protein QAD02_017733 [Eretmocerus hayati]
MDSGAENSNSLGNAPATTEGNTPSNTFEKCDWDDEIFLKDFASLAACNARPQISQGIPAAKALLNWYMGGDEPNNPTDAILTTFYCMRIDNANDPAECWPLFTDKLMINGPELLPISAVEKIEPKKYYSKLMRVPTKKKEKLPDGAFTRELASKWYTGLWKMLEDESLKDRQAAVNVIGFLYMILMRLSVKDVLSVSKYILEKSRGTFKDLWEEPALEIKIFCPPHRAMASSFKMKYARLQPNCIKVMSAIVYSLYDGEKFSIQLIIPRTLRAGCLSALENTGLGLLSWTNRAASAFDIEVKKLTKYVLETSTDQRHKDTVLSLFKSLFKFNKSDSAQVTWHWARLFRDGALADLRIAENPSYVMIMVAIVNLIRNDTNMWSVPSLNKKDIMTHKEAATLQAERIKGKYRLDLESKFKREMEEREAMMRNRAIMKELERLRSVTGRRR